MSCLGFQKVLNFESILFLAHSAGNCIGLSFLDELAHTGSYQEAGL
jgi:hypothetical protein